MKKRKDVKCDCNGWLENNEKLNNIFLIAHIHRVKYDGETFNFCPWCGKEFLND